MPEVARSNADTPEQRAMDAQPRQRLAVVGRKRHANVGQNDARVRQDATAEFNLFEHPNDAGESRRDRFPRHGFAW